MTDDARPTAAHRGARPVRRPSVGPARDAAPARALAVARTLALSLALSLAIALLGAASAQDDDQDQAPPPGQAVYERVCASCHLASGQGTEGVYPALDGSPVVTGEEDELILQILAGGGGMPAFDSSLSDQEIADVSSYVRSAWSNDAGAIDAETVAQVRDASGAEEGPEPEADQADGDADADVEPDFAWQELGAEVYGTSCAACHQAEGQGIPPVYPALAGNGYVQADATEVVRTILNGRAGMPSFGGDLGDERLAAVVSYIRNSWGNEAPVVTPAFVEDVRGGASDVDPTDPSYRPGAAN